VEEAQKSSQFYLQTGVETVTAFSLDVHGTAWKTIRPSWIVAYGIVDEFQG